MSDKEKRYLKIGVWIAMRIAHLESILEQGPQIGGVEATKKELEDWHRTNITSRLDELRKIQSEFFSFPNKDSKKSEQK